LLTVNIGWLGLQHILRVGGSGYFPARVVKKQIDAGRIHAVADAPEFHMPAYVASVRDRQDETLSRALALIHELAAQKNEL
jgi:hypothetical protein